MHNVTTDKPRHLNRVLLVPRKRMQFTLPLGKSRAMGGQATRRCKNVLAQAPHTQLNINRLFIGRKWQMMFNLADSKCVKAMFT